MLPTISLNASANDMDITKQFASLRSQIATLRDAIDDELNSISYEQLDASLRKKIDGIDESITSAQETTAIVAQTLKAKYITATEITATYATITNLNAAVARVGSLEADSVTVHGNISSINGDISAINGTVSGLRGEFDVVKANYVSTSYLTSNYITASSISSTYLKTSNLSSQLANLNNVSINSMSLTTSIIVNLGSKSYNLKPMILNGYVVLGTYYS